MEHRDGLHEKEANVLTEHAAGKLLAAHPAPHLTVHDLESAVLITAAAAAVSMRLHVKEANVLHRHAAVGPLAVHPAAQFPVPDSEAAVHITPAANAVSIRVGRRMHGARGGSSEKGLASSGETCRSKNREAPREGN